MRDSFCGGISQEREVKKYIEASPLLKYAPSFMKEQRPDAKMLIFLGRTPLRIHKGLCRQLLLKQPLWENRKEEEGRQTSKFF